MLREFILGSNQTGLVTNTSGAVSVVGGESTSLAAEVLPGQSGILVGTGTTQSTYTFPAATIAAWESFIATATAISTLPGSGDLSPSPTSPGADQNQSGAAAQLASPWLILTLCTVLVFWQQRA